MTSENSIGKLTGFLIEKTVGNLVENEAQGHPNNDQKRAQKNSEKMSEKKSRRPCKSCENFRKPGGGVPPTDLLRRTTIQANPSKLTRANKLSQAKPEPYEHSTCARGTVADFSLSWLLDRPLCKTFNL